MHALAAWLTSVGVSGAHKSGRTVRSACPFHGSDTSGFGERTFSLYPSGRYVCWSGRCGLRGELADLEAFFGRPAPRYELQGLDESPSFRTIPRYRLAPYRMAYPEAAARGVYGGEVDAWDLRWDHREDYGGLLIPLHDEEGRIVSCSWRYPDARRYRHEEGIDKSALLYGLWRVTGSTVTLVEGHADCWKLWQLGIPAVASLGAYLSPRQVRLLVRAGIAKVRIGYDNDLAGFAGAIVAFDLLHKMLDTDFVMDYKGAWPKDPGEADMTVARRLQDHPLGFEEVWGAATTRWRLEWKRGSSSTRDSWSLRPR